MQIKKESFFKREKNVQRIMLLEQDKTSISYSKPVLNSRERKCPSPLPPEKVTFCVLSRPELNKDSPGATEVLSKEKCLNSTWF